MTVHVPRWVLAVLALVVAAGVGFAAASFIGDDSDGDSADETLASEDAPPCNEAEGLAASKKIGIELTGDPQLATEIGKQFGMQVVDLGAPI